MKLQSQFLLYRVCSCCSVAKRCPTLCSLMNCSTPGFPVHHLSQFVQTDVHWVSDAIQAAHSLSFPSPLSLNLSQHQGLFQWEGFFASCGQGIGASASVLPKSIQGWFPLRLTGLISLLSKDSQESSPASQFESINSSVLSLLYGPILTSIRTAEKTIA